MIEGGLGEGDLEDVIILIAAIDLSLAKTSRDEILPRPLEFDSQRVTDHNPLQVIVDECFRCRTTGPEIVDGAS